MTDTESGPYIRPLKCYEVWDGGLLMLVTSNRGDARAAASDSGLTLIEREWRAVL